MLGPGVTIRVWPGDLAKATRRAEVIEQPKGDFTYGNLGCDRLLAPPGNVRVPPGGVASALAVAFAVTRFERGGGVVGGVAGGPVLQVLVQVR